MHNRYPAWLVLLWAAYGAVLPWYLQPASAWRDGPEFVVAAWGLGISHPAGFPLYQSLTWMFEQLPLADIVLRNHAFSAIFTLIAAVLLYEAALSLLRYLNRGKDVPDRERYLAGWVSISWLFMPSQLENAIQAEAYSLFAAFIFLICKLLFDFLISRESRKYILAVFIAGIGCGNHATLGVFLFPFIIALGVYRYFGEALWTALGGVLAGLWGLSIYLYLPVRSLMEPTFDWGNPETWSRFWAQVLDRKDTGTHFSQLSDSVQDISEPFSLHFLVLEDWFGSIGLLLMVCGWGWLLVRYPRVALMSLSWMGVLFLFFLGWASGTVLTGFLGMLLLGVLIVLRELMLVSGRQLGKVCTLAAVLIAGAVFYNVYTAGMRFMVNRADYLPSELVRAQLLNLPYRASILAGPSWFQLRGLADLEGLRPDVSIVGLGDVISPQYFRPLQSRHIPLLHFPTVMLPEIGEPLDSLKVQFLKELMFMNADQSQFFLDLDENYLHVFFDYVLPSESFWWAKLATHPVQNDCRQASSNFSDSLLSMLNEPGALLDPEFGQFIQYGYFSWFKIAMNRQPQCINTAKGMLRWWQHWFGDVKLKPGVQENDMGVVFATAGFDRGARIMFQLADSINNVDGGRNLAVWFQQHGNGEAAAKQFRRIFLRSGDVKSFQAYRELMRGSYEN